MSGDMFGCQNWGYECDCHLAGRGQGWCIPHPTMHGAVSHKTKNCLAQNVNSARLRNSDLGQHGFIGGFMNI